MNDWKTFFRKHADGIALAGIVCCTVLLFVRALPFGTCEFDDAFYVGQQQMLRLNWINVRYYFTHTVLRLYSPLAMYSYMIDFSLWGPEGFHAGIRLQSLLWHITATAFFYGLLRLLRFRRSDGETVTLSPTFAFLTALTFSLHPQRIESVVWLSERKDVLMAAFGLASLYFFLKAHRKGRTSIAAPVLLFLSFGTKPMLITLPCVMALLLWSQDRRFDVRLWVRRLAPSVCAVLAYAVLNALQVGSALFSTQLLKRRILCSLWNTGNYFTRVYLPCDLQTIYPLFDLRTASLWRGITLAGIILLLVLWGAFHKRYRSPVWYGVLPCLLAFAGTLFPVSGIVPVGNVDCADRYAYFPSVFLGILLGFSLQVLWNAFPRYRKIVTVLFFFYAAALAAQTHFLLDSWKSSRHYLAAALDTPDPSPAVLWLAASAAASDGQMDELNLRLLQLARTSSDPRHLRRVELYSLLTHGVALFQRQDPDHGIRFLDAALSASDWNSLRFISYGMLKKGLLLAASYHHRKKHVRNAEILFRMAADVAAETDVIEAECYRGVSALLHKDLDAAERHFLNVLFYAPEDRNVLANLQTVRMLKTRAAQQKEVVKK